MQKNNYPSLKKSLEAEVIIVGGGLVGIQSAYLLAQAGKTVIVLEKETLGADATQHTTAFITSYIDTDAAAMKKIYGLKQSRLIYQSGQDAIESIAAIIKKEKLDCEFMRVSNFVYANTPDQVSGLAEEQKAIAAIGGLQTKLMKKQEPEGFLHAGHLELKKQAKFHPLKYLYQLAEKAVNSGVQIYEHTEVAEIGKNNIVTIKDSANTVTGEWVINATYDPLGNPIKTKFKKGMYISYVIELEMQAGAIPEGLYEDTENPYHYFRVDTGQQNDRVLLGGADHRSELPMDEKKNYSEIQKYAKKIFAGIDFRIVRKWSGPILEPSDGLPLIGKIADRQFVAAAFSGNGMTYSMVAAALFRDSIIQKKNPYIKLYDPTRVPSLKQLAHKGLDYTQEFFQGAVKNAITQ